MANWNIISTVEGASGTATEVLLPEIPQPVTSPPTFPPVSNAKQFALYADSTTHLAYWSQNGSPWAVAFGSGSGGPPFLDNVILMENHTDTTKKLQLTLGGLTTATTRTWTVQDHNITVAGIDYAQTWTADQTFPNIAVNNILTVQGPAPMQQTLIQSDTIQLINATGNLFIGMNETALDSWVVFQSSVPSGSSPAFQSIGGIFVVTGAGDLTAHSVTAPTLTITGTITAKQFVSSDTTGSDIIFQAHTSSLFNVLANGDLTANTVTANSILTVQGPSPQQQTLIQNDTIQCINSTGNLFFSVSETSVDSWVVFQSSVTGTNPAFQTIGGVLVITGAGNLNTTQTVSAATISGTLVESTATGSTIGFKTPSATFSVTGGGGVTAVSYVATSTLTVQGPSPSQQTLIQSDTVQLFNATGNLVISMGETALDAWVVFQSSVPVGTSPAFQTIGGAFVVTGAGNLTTTGSVTAGSISTPTLTITGTITAKQFVSNDTTGADVVYRNNGSSFTVTGAGNVFATGTLTVQSASSPQQQTFIQNDTIQLFNSTGNLVISMTESALDSWVTFQSSMTGSAAAFQTISGVLVITGAGNLTTTQTVTAGTISGTLVQSTATGSATAFQTPSATFKVTGAGAVTTGAVTANGAVYINNQTLTVQASTNAQTVIQADTITCQNNTGNLVFFVTESAVDAYVVFQSSVTGTNPAFQTIGGAFVVTGAGNLTTTGSVTAGSISTTTFTVTGTITAKQFVSNDTTGSDIVFRNNGSTFTVTGSGIVFATGTLTVQSATSPQQQTVIQNDTVQMYNSTGNLVISMTESALDAWVTFQSSVTGSAAAFQSIGGAFVVTGAGNLTAASVTTSSFTTTGTITAKQFVSNDTTGSDIVYRNNGSTFSVTGSGGLTAYSATVTNTLIVQGPSPSQQTLIQSDTIQLFNSTGNLVISMGETSLDAWVTFQSSVTGTNAAFQSIGGIFVVTGAGYLTAYSGKISGNSTTFGDRLLQIYDSASTSLPGISLYNNSSTRISQWRAGGSSNYAFEVMNDASTPVSIFEITQTGGLNINTTGGSGLTINMGSFGNAITCNPAQGGSIIGFYSFVVGIGEMNSLWLPPYSGGVTTIPNTGGIGGFAFISGSTYAYWNETTNPATGSPYGWTAFNFASGGGTGVPSITGTANQVLVNGTSGSPVTSAATLTLAPLVQAGAFQATDTIGPVFYNSGSTFSVSYNGFVLAAGVSSVFTGTATGTNMSFLNTTYISGTIPNFYVQGNGLVFAQNYYAWISSGGYIGGASANTLTTYSAITSISIISGLIIGLSGTSDARLKDIIEPYVYGIDAIRKLRPYRYRFNALFQSVYHRDDLDHIGLLAQDVESAMPTAWFRDAKGYGGIDWNGVTCSLIVAAQQTDVRIQQTDTRIAALESELAELKRRLN